jgi:3-hydroxybutyryl-CoA dehydrogenase
MVEEGVIAEPDEPAALARIEERVGLGDLGGCAFVQEALPESLELKRETFKRLAGRVAADAILATTSSTISPAHLADAVDRPERFLVAHWLNPAHIIPLVEVVPGRATAPAVVEETLRVLEKLGKVPVRCNDSPGFIGPRLQVLLMNEAVRLVEEGVATPEDVDKAFRAGMGFRYASIGIFEFIDWGGVDILYRASRFMAETLGDDRFRPARLVEQKMAYNELGPKTGRGFFDYGGERRHTFETQKIRALLRQLKRERERAGDRP